MMITNKTEKEKLWNTVSLKQILIWYSNQFKSISDQFELGNHSNWNE